MADYSATDAGAGMVSAGIGQFFKGQIDGMYASFQNNTAINNQFGTARGALFTVITYVPDPYADPQIKSMFLNYRSLSIYFVILFILGGFISRNLALSHVSENVFGNRDLSTSSFINGMAVCFIGLCANFFFMFALKVIQALSQFAMANVLDSIAPSPDNLVLFLMMAICDFTVFIFFIIRYFIIYIVAVLITVIAVLLVPNSTRDFAKKTLDHIIRILLLQPVTIFVTCLGILIMKGLPLQFQPFGYIGLTALVLLTCLYMLIGDFAFIKNGGKALIGVVLA